MFPNLKRGIVLADHNTGEKIKISKDGANSVRRSGYDINKSSVIGKKSFKKQDDTR